MGNGKPQKHALGAQNLASGILFLFQNFLKKVVISGKSSAYNLNRVLIYRSFEGGKVEEMNILLQSIAVTICILMLVGLFRMMKKKKLSESRALLWIMGVLGLLILSCFPGILKWVAGILGIWWAPASLIFFLLIIIILIVFYNTLVISQLEGQAVEMAIQIALLKERNKEIEQDMEPESRKEA